MDKLHVNQTGGFPMTTNILNAMQNAYNIFNALGNLAGNFTIISGCVETGSIVSDGVVFINGEVLVFKGGTKISKVRIVENTESKEFEDGSTKTVIFKRFVEFGTGVDAIDWSKFKRYYPYNAINKEVKWVGRSVTQEELPNNWYIADGNNGTDNILGRFIVGYDSNQVEFNAVGKIDGEKEHKLTIEELAAHSHSGITDSNGSHNHDYTQEPQFNNGNSVLVSGGELGMWAGKTTKSTSSNGNHNHQFDTNTTGEGTPHNNLPPYIVMIPIQFVI